MKLAEYIEHKGLSRAQFAAQIGVSAGTITQWCDGTIWPGRDNAQKIFAITKGEVTPTDFLDAAAEPVE